MRVKIEYLGIFAETQKALLLKLPTFHEIWIPKTIVYEFVGRKYIITEEWFCEKNSLPFIEFINKPNKIEVTEKGAIEELKWEA